MIQGASSCGQNCGSSRQIRRNILFTRFFPLNLVWLNLAQGRKSLLDLDWNGELWENSELDYRSHLLHLSPDTLARSWGNKFIHLMPWPSSQNLNKPLSMLIIYRISDVVSWSEFILYSTDSNWKAPLCAVPYTPGPRDTALNRADMNPPLVDGKVRHVAYQQYQTKTKIQ